jgi:hypothetical protein
MKRIICLLAVVLMIASVVYAAPKIKITAKSLPALKGTWEGMLGFGTMEGGGSSPVKFEILSDTVPVKAKVTITNVPSNVAQEFGLQAGLNVGESDEGLITSQGTLMFTGPQKNFFEFTSTGDKKASIWYVIRGLKGEANLKKK